MVSGLRCSRRFGGTAPDIRRVDRERRRLRPL